jgi:hypothetical protein
MDRKLIETVLAAEIMGHYRRIRCWHLGGVLSDSANPIANGLRESMEKRPSALPAPQDFTARMHSAYVSLQSTDPVVHDNGVEFMDRCCRRYAAARHPALRS